jgi:hypothetical protein
MGIKPREFFLSNRYILSELSVFFFATFAVKKILTAKVTKVYAKNAKKFVFSTLEIF